MLPVPNGLCMWQRLTPAQMKPRHAVAYATIGIRCASTDFSGDRVHPSMLEDGGRGISTWPVATHACAMVLRSLMASGHFYKKKALRMAAWSPTLEQTTVAQDQRNSQLGFGCHCLVDEIWPPPPVALVTGALHTNEKTSDAVSTQTSILHTEKRQSECTYRLELL